MLFLADQSQIEGYSTIIVILKESNIQAHFISGHKTNISAFTSVSLKISPELKDWPLHIYNLC